MVWESMIAVYSFNKLGLLTNVHDDECVLSPQRNTPKLCRFQWLMAVAGHVTQQAVQVLKSNIYHCMLHSYSARTNTR